MKYSHESGAQTSYKYPRVTLLLKGGNDKKISRGFYYQTYGGESVVPKRKVRLNKNERVWVNRPCEVLGKVRPGAGVLG